MLSFFRKIRQQLLKDNIDVSAFTASCIEQYPVALQNYQSELTRLSS